MFDKHTLISASSIFNVPCLEDFKFNIVENETSQTYVVENYRIIFNAFLA